MPAIEASEAWDMIRAAARQPACRLPWSPVPGLTIGADGSWQATCAVSPEAAQLLDALLPIACGGPDYVVAQIGQSLDGRIATATGHACYVTGYASRVHLHRLRALVDAVLVGANTAIVDNPQLTVRHVSGDSPVRVVVDPNGRVPHDIGLFSGAGPATWHAVRDPAKAARGARVIALPPGSGAITDALLDALARQGLRRILVEGGCTTISHFIQAGRVDRLHVVVAPFLIGSGRPSLALDEIETLDEALRPACRSYALGEDRLYDLDLRKPRSEPGGKPSTST